MDIGAYITASAMIANQKVLRSVANNMANSLTPGFKGELSRMASVPLAVADDKNAQGITPLAFVETMPSVPDAAQGAMENTGKKLDLAINGSGYFQVRTPEGLKNTRGGSLQVNPDGILVDREGRPLMGEEGEVIEIGEEGEIHVMPNGEIRVIPDGELQGGGAIVGKISIVDKAGAPVREGESSIWQGYLEMSNVNAVQEMIKMMEVMRSNQTCTKLVQAFDQLEEKMIRDVGKA